MTDTMTKAELLDELRSARAEWEALMNEVDENMAIRQSLKHTRRPQFVGNIDNAAPYKPERIQRGKWEVA